MLELHASGLDSKQPENNQIISADEKVTYKAFNVSDSRAFFLNSSAKKLPGGTVIFQLYVLTKGYAQEEFEVDFELTADTFSFMPNEGGLSGRFISFVIFVIFRSPFVRNRV